MSVGQRTNRRQFLARKVGKRFVPNRYLLITLEERELATDAGSLLALNLNAVPPCFCRPFSGISFNYRADIAN